jgi:hypothetical protein
MRAVKEYKLTDRPRYEFNSFTPLHVLDAIFNCDKKRSVHLILFAPDSIQVSKIELEGFRRP